MDKIFERQKILDCAKRSMLLFHQKKMMIWKVGKVRFKKVYFIEKIFLEGLYVGAYDRRRWAFVGNLFGSPQTSQYCNILQFKFWPILDFSTGTLKRSESLNSTQSEHEFSQKYQALAHRMVHRKSSALMYNNILERKFGNSKKNLNF